MERISLWIENIQVIITTLAVTIIRNDNRNIFQMKIKAQNKTYEQKLKLDVKTFTKISILQF